MKYYEVIRDHGYLHEVLGLHVEAENAEEARKILEGLGYEIEEIDDEFERIIVK